jgi:hypothetical protein
MSIGFVRDRQLKQAAFQFTFYPCRWKHHVPGLPVQATLRRIVRLACTRTPRCERLGGYQLGLPQECL